MNLIRTQNTQGGDKRQHAQVSGATNWWWGEEDGRGKRRRRGNLVPGRDDTLELSSGFTPGTSLTRLKLRTSPSEVSPGSALGTQAAPYKKRCWAGWRAERGVEGERNLTFIKI